MTAVLLAALAVGILSHVSAAMPRKGGELRDRSEGLYRYRPLDHFSQTEIEKGKSYQLTKYGLFFLKSGVVACGVVILLGIGGHGILEAFALRVTGGRQVPAVSLAMAAFFVQICILAFPFNLYGGYVLERSYGLLTQGYTGWLLDHAKGRAIELALLAAVGSATFLLVRRFPSNWWLVTGCSSAVLVPVFVFLAPAVIDPLFYRFTPIESAPVRGMLLGLADRAGVQVGEVLEMNASSKTTRWNAYVAGIGSTKRIVVYDTLVRNATPGQIGAVFAHELGHWRRKHLWKGVAICSLASIVAFFIVGLILRAATNKGLFGITDPASFGGIAVVFLSLALLDYASLPVQSWVSRRFEREADQEALALTGDPRTFIEVQELLAARNLADVTPSPFLVWLFYSHPPAMERIALAEAMQRTVDRAGARQGPSDAVRKVRASGPSVERPRPKLGRSDTVGKVRASGPSVDRPKLRQGPNDAAEKVRDSGLSKTKDRPTGRLKQSSGPSKPGAPQPATKKANDRKKPAEDG